MFRFSASDSLTSKSLSPVSICCHTQEKGSEDDSAVLLELSEIGIKKTKINNNKKTNAPKLASVAGSIRLFLEMYLLSGSAREKEGETGHGHRNYTSFST